VRYFTFIFTWLANLFEPSPLVTRTFDHEFAGRNAARLTLSSRHPRYFCEFTEPLPSYDLSEFMRWRSECLTEFEKVSGVKISEGCFGNERILSYPAPQLHEPKTRRNRNEF
jgi:hypothetical protein